MTWIESHSTLADHPKKYRLMRELEIDENSTVGLLHHLWWWAIDNAEDGQLGLYPPKVLARVCRFDGDPEALLPALVASGFLDDDLGIHEWDWYAHRLLTKRERARERAREAYARRVESLRVDSAKPTQEPTPVSTSLQDRTGQDKTKPPKWDPKKVEFPENLRGPDFQKAWGAWCDYRRKNKKALSSDAVNLQLPKLAKWGPQKSIEAIERSIESDYQGLFEPKSSGPPQKPDPAYVDLAAIRAAERAAAMAERERWERETPAEEKAALAAQMDELAQARLDRKRGIR